MNPYRALRLFLMTLVVALSFAQIMAGEKEETGELRILSQSNADYGRLSLRIKVWLTAIRSRDVPLLLELSIPEDREFLRPHLEDPNSSLSLSLFGESGSIRSRLSRFKKAGMMILAHSRLQQKGRGTSVCFFDETSNEIEWPKSYSELVALHESERVFCGFWYFADNQWWFSFMFAEDEGEDCED